MLFTALLYLTVFLAAASVIVFVYEATTGKLGDAIGFFFLMALASMVPAFFVVVVWLMHSSDLSKVTAQAQVIAVYEDRLESLTARLDSITYPEGALMNADTPVGAIVTAINDAEEDIAFAKREMATAIRRIEARRLGPMSGVIAFVGGTP